ncbi:MAG: TnpV protein [Clostridia bacterium]|nr:TnpV protein [Clostridia bacterium]
MKQNELTYTQNGDYQIPDLRLSEQETKPLGKYGRMRKNFLREHRPVTWNNMILSETLYPHLREIDETANRRLSQMMQEMAKSAGVTEKLKESNPMEWTKRMNSLKAQAEEVILNELIYS